MGMKQILSVVLVYVTLCLLASTEPVEDKNALLDFIRNIHHSRILNWDEKISVCNNSWIGVTCSHDNSRVISVRLPAIGFKGSIPTNTLGRLSALQILSLRSNGITGPFPSDLLKLRNLTCLHLESNNFEGPLPLDFSVWENLSLLNLSNNRFNGGIPSSISNLTHLVALDLSNNSLSGYVPDLSIPTLQLLDLSNNNLTGVVSPHLQRFPNSSISGNGFSLQNSTPPASAATSAHKKHSSKFSKSTILGIVIGSCVVALAAIVFLLIVINRRKRGGETGISQKTEKLTKRMGSQHQEGNGRIMFFEGCNLAFDLEDLLRASAEVLGKGTFGTTYKAALEDATTVAVKRLKEVVVGRKDFEQQMEVVGHIRHDNVAPLRAYYYSKDEKLMVYDFYNHGSVSTLLHAKRGDKNMVVLDWETRLKIGIGVARGIAHIHTQCGGKLVHGNIKSSNIFLNSQQYGCVSDLELATLMSLVSPPVVRSGYRAPEVTNTRKVSQATDVYSYGVFLLELLTGKSPVHSSGGGEEVIHLVRWVNSVVHEEWTGEVFDVDLLRYPHVEEEMVSMLQIGLSCTAKMPEQRPKMEDVLKMVEDIRVVDMENCSHGGTRSHPSSPNLTQHVHEIGSSN